MSKMRALLMSAMLVCCMGALPWLTGCNQPPEAETSQAKSYSDNSAGPMNCVIVYSQHANSKASPAGMEKYVRGAKEAEGYLGFVRLDGAPELVGGGQAETEHKNETRIERENKKFVEEKMAELENIKAVEPEVDILGAIEEANAYLPERSNNLNNVVVVVGTGLSTTGAIDFTNADFATFDFADYAAWLEQQGLLPNLSHIDKLVWCGFSEIAAPQEKFTSPLLEEKLQGFYTTVLKSAGIKDIEFQKGNSETIAASDLPSVSVVPMPPKPEYFSKGESFELPADVLFTPDEATFLAGTDPYQNPNIVKTAESLKGDATLKVVLTGYTAHYGTQAHGGNEGLAKERAEALKAVLVDMGAPANRIETVGGGWGPYEDDQANRCVKFEFV